jgi:hypothetical protein
MPFAHGVIVFVHSDAFRPLQSAAVREFYGQAFSEEQLLGVVVFDHGSTIAVRFGCDQLTYRIPRQMAGRKTDSLTVHAKGRA